MKTCANSSRRSFLKQSSLASAALLMPIPNFIKKKNYKMGLQLFTIRDAMAIDPVATLKQVTKLGYEDGELYGFNEKEGAYYGLKAKEFKKVLDDINFSISSGHYNFSDFFKKPEEELLSYVDKCIEGSHTIGAKYITWPWLAPEYRNLDNFKLLSGKLNKIGERVTNAGLHFAYHNHGFEFEEENGQVGYDIILRETDPELVKLQIDLYWVKHSSTKSPEEWIAQNPSRYVMWHIKDMDKVTRDYSELGNGSIDYQKMLQGLNKESLDYYYIEQGDNFAENSMQSISDSATYFKKHLQHLI